MSPAVAEDSALVEQLAANGETLVYELIRKKAVADDGTVTFEIVSELGTHDLATFQRYARPASFVHEDTTYALETWEHLNPDGTIELGMRVTSIPNTTPYIPEVTLGPPVVAEDLLSQTEGPDAGQPLSVLIKLRNFPEWDVPLLPSIETVSIDTYLEAADAKAAAEASRAELLDVMAQGVTAEILDAGGTVHHGYPQVGWLAATLPWGALPTLAERTDLAMIHSASAPDAGIGLDNHQARAPARMGLQGYWDDGHKGLRANPAPGQSSRIVIAVIEPGPLEDEACGFTDGASCNLASSRILAKYRCDVGQGACDLVSDYNEATEQGPLPPPAPPAANHGTTVAAAALADYTPGQGTGWSLGDPAWTSGAHSSTWERSASGMAPEAGLVYFGMAHPTSAMQAFGNALLDAWYEQGADIITGGYWIVGPPQPAGQQTECDPPFTCNVGIQGSSAFFAEELAEIAFDQGVFLAMPAGNYCGPTSPTCKVVSIASKPKVFAVNGLNMTGCFSDYRECKVDSYASARGGGTIPVAGQTPLGWVSMIDLVVPSNLSHHMVALGPKETIVISPIVGGTSVAAPRAAGAAADLKDEFLADGKTWIDLPGWLHTIMLGMGDRHFSTTPANPSVPTAQRTKGADSLYGLGRLKLRHIGQTGGVWKSTRSGVTFTPSVPDHKFLAFGGPTPAGTELIKCVMLQHEDMSHKPNISNIDLKIELRAPTASGTCSQDPSPLASLTDDGTDTKSMVALDADNGQVANRCVWVTREKKSLTSQGIATTTYCFAIGSDDDEPWYTNPIGPGGSP